MPDEEYRAVVRASRRRKQPIAQVVRESLRRTLAEDVEDEPERRIAAVLRYARFEGPTADIEQILHEIDRGRGLP